MFYSEIHSSPVLAEGVGRLFGIDPDAQPVAARAAGIYPLIDPPAGYSASHYVKEGNAYRAVPNLVSHDEHSMVATLQKHAVDHDTLRGHVLPAWDIGTTYDEGDEVQHSGVHYIKVPDPDDHTTNIQGEPGVVADAWQVLT